MLQPLSHLLKIEQGFAQDDEHGATHGAGWQDDDDDKHGDEQDEYDEHGCAQDDEYVWTGVLTITFGAHDEEQEEEHDGAYGRTQDDEQDDEHGCAQETRR